MICDITPPAPLTTRMIAGLLGGIAGMIPLWFVGNVYLLPAAIVFGVLLGVIMRWLPSCTGQSIAAGFFYGVLLGMVYQLAAHGVIDTPGLQFFGIFGIVAIVVARLYLRRVW